MTHAETFEALIRGIACGAFAASLLGLARANCDGSLRVAGLLFWASAMAFALIDLPDAEALFGPAVVPIYLLQVGAVGYLWLFFVALFEDRRVRPLDLLAPAALTLFAVGAYFNVQPAGRRFWVLHHLLQFGLVAHVLVVVFRSWRGDLVEARRRLRGPFAAAAALFATSIAALNMATALGYRFAYPGLAIAAALAALAIGGAYVFLEARGMLFGAAGDKPAPAAAVPDADQWLAGRIAGLMDQDALWRREGLTIGALAEAAGAPEHRVRRLINDRLGHRNFAAFVNERRIAAARDALADPARARTTVAAIAFELGFGSLGPFNRAFREATGLTPTEYRRRALGEGSPIPASAG